MSNEDSVLDARSVIYRMLDSTGKLFSLRHRDRCRQGGVCIRKRSGLLRPRWRPLTRQRCDTDVDAGSWEVEGRCKMEETKHR